jgi:hypothetical protein
MEMEMTEIRKQSLGVMEINCAEVLNVTQAAKEILGYSVLAKLKGNIDPASPLTPLQEALKGLEIDVLHLGDVQAYKKERLVEQTVINLKVWMEEMKATEEIHTYTRYSSPSWDSTKIEEYRQPIPEFVLAKAIQIKKAFPDCSIFVESLETHPDPFLVVGIEGQKYCPLLEKYYVEVWAEPKFEGRIRETDIPF